LGGVVVLLLGPVEEERGGVHELRQHCLVAGGLSLSQAAALLAASDVYLGNDSGITHLAAALGVPTVALFGPSDPRQWAPRGRQVAIVRRAIECSPCSNLTMTSCPHRACLTDLYPEKVIAIIAQWKTDRESRYLDKVGVRD
jgi:ADP-heptose:LPS heptosyltransferase